MVTSWGGPVRSRGADPLSGREGEVAGVGAGAWGLVGRRPAFNGTNGSSLEEAGPAGSLLSWASEPPHPGAWATSPHWPLARSGKHSWGCYEWISGQQGSAEPVELGGRGCSWVGLPRPLPRASSDCARRDPSILPGPGGCALRVTSAGAWHSCPRHPPWSGGALGQGQQDAGVWPRHPWEMGLERCLPEAGR